jgi:ACR3 family arsenite transporter
MVMIWNQLAKGDGNYCAILVVFNSILQIILYSPYALLFINVIGGQSAMHVSYGNVAISVLIVCLPCGVVLISATYLRLPST